jgi:hypothetical protein
MLWTGIGVWISYIWILHPELSVDSGLGCDFLITFFMKKPLSAKMTPLPANFIRLPA